MIFALIKELIGVGAGALERRQRRQEVKLEAETKVTIARAEAEVARLGKAQDAEIAWDNETASQMDRTWKDEYWTLLLSGPLLLSFFGEWGRERAVEGFAAIQTVPEWYMYSIGLAIASSFGYRALINKFAARK
jgi:hypothetical protein